MEDLLKAIRDNDLSAYIKITSQLMLIQPAKDEDKPAKTDAEMIQAILAHPRLVPTTRVIISGIGKFLEERAYLSDKQRETVVAMYRQYITPSV